MPEVGARSTSDPQAYAKKLDGAGQTLLQAAQATQATQVAQVAQQTQQTQQNQPQRSKAPQRHRASHEGKKASVQTQPVSGILLSLPVYRPDAEAPSTYPVASLLPLSQSPPPLQTVSSGQPMLGAPMLTVPSLYLPTDGAPSNPSFSYLPQGLSPFSVAPGDAAAASSFPSVSPEGVSVMPLPLYSQSVSWMKPESMSRGPSARFGFSRSPSQSDNSSVRVRRRGDA